MLAEHCFSEFSNLISNFFHSFQAGFFSAFVVAVDFEVVVTHYVLVGVNNGEGFVVIEDEPFLAHEYSNTNLFDFAALHY